MSRGLRKAIAIVGTQTALARVLGVRQGHIWAWLNRNNLPSEKVVTIAHATHWEVTPHQLRPDVYPNPWDALPMTMARQMLCDCYEHGKGTPPESELARPDGWVGPFFEVKNV